MSPCLLGYKFFFLFFFSPSKTDPKNLDPFYKMQNFGIVLEGEKTIFNRLNKTYLHIWVILQGLGREVGVGGSGEKKLG